MTIHINGEPRELAESITIQELIGEIGLSPLALAVAVNSEIVPRSQFETVRLRNRDQVEIIRAVGGG